jgi:DNA-binding protein YbaB
MFEGFDFSKLGTVFEEAQKKAKEMEEKSSNISFTAKSGGGLDMIFRYFLRNGL